MVLRAAALAVLLLPSAPSSSTGHARGNCRALVLGYLWSDGHQSGKTWHYRTRSAAIATQFDGCVKAVGATVVRSSHHGIVDFTVRHLPLTVNLPGVPPDLAGAPTTDVKAFLAAVIEGEGSRSGLVMDDPHRSRGEAVATLLKRVRVGTRMKGSSFLHVYADSADWPVIHTFPFVVWDRVPGGR